MAPERAVRGASRAEDRYPKAPWLESLERCRTNAGVRGHECQLPSEDDVVIHYVYEGYCVALNRRLKMWCTVTVDNYESKLHFKSTANILLEAHRHLKHYPTMIHPFSNMREFWELVMIFVYFMLNVMIPLEVSLPRVHWYFWMPKLLLDIIALIDVILWFRTGYHDPFCQKVILTPKQVRWHYFTGYFFIDFLSSLPVNAIIHIFKLYVYEDMSFYMYMAKALGPLKVFRMSTMTLYIKRFCDRRRMWSYKFSLFANGFYFFLFVLWLTGLTRGVHHYNQPHNHEISIFSANFLGPFLRVFDSVIRKMLLISIESPQWTLSDYQIKIDELVQLIIIWVGACFNIILFFKIVQYFRRTSVATNKENKIIQQTIEYMNYKELPPSLRTRVLDFFKFKLSRQIFVEQEVIPSLSNILRQDVVLHKCKKLIDNVDLFQNLPPELVINILFHFKSELYLPNDEIFQAGSPGHCMYFVYVGTLAVYAEDGKEVSHLHDGNHFGEISLIVNEKRITTVIAVKECELFRLTRRDFQDAMAPYPELGNKIRIMVMDRLEGSINSAKSQQSKTDVF